MNGCTVNDATQAPRRASLAHNVTAMYALQLANYVIPLVTLPYLIRTLGPENYGVMATAYAIVYLMVLFVDAGFNSLATRQLARPGIDPGRISEVYLTTQLIKLAQCIAMFLLLYTLSVVVPKINAAAPVYLATFPIVVGSLLFPTWLFQGLEVMHVTTVCSVAGRLLATLGIFVFVRDSGDLTAAALLQASATAMSGLLAMPFVFGRLRLRLTVPWCRLVAQLRGTIANARALAPAEYVTDAIGNSGVFVLGLFAGDAAVGIYAAIEKVARAGASLFLPLIKALFPPLAGRWLSGTAEAADRCRRWTRRILLSAIVAATALYVLAPFTLELLFGNGWAEHAVLLRILAAWLAASIAATTLGQLWLLARGERSTYARCLLVAGVWQLLAALVGAGFYGSVGLVAAAVAAEIARLALFAAAARDVARGARACAS